MLAWEPTDGQEEEFVGGPRGMFRGRGAVLVLLSRRLPLRLRELCWSEDS